MNVTKMIGVGALAALAATTGCAEEEGLPPSIGSGTGDGEGSVIAPSFPEGQGQAANSDDVAYPFGPYGWEVGAVARDISFIGFADYSNPALEGVQGVSLSDFYNPDGAGVFGAGSPFGEGTPKPKAVVLVMSARWCQPCRIHAEEMNADADHYGDDVVFMTALLQNQQAGQAEVADIAWWADQFNVQYPVMLDPDRTIQRFYEPSWPGNIIIDTETMTIVRREAGIPQDGGLGASFWDTLDDVVAN